MKLKDGFIIHQTDNEQVMIATEGTGFTGLVRSNKTAAFIVDCLKEDITEREIVNKMLSKYNADEEIIAKDVKKILDKLRRIGAIDE